MDNLEDFGIKGIEIDDDTDAGYITISSGMVSRTVVYRPNVLLDLDDQGNILGIEIL